MRLPLTRCLLGLCLLASTSVARAEPKDDARRHFVQGLEDAREQRFHDALAHFHDAQRIYPHPATLYNIARTYTDLGDLPAALEYYRLFRAAAPDKASDVDPIIAVLQARVEQASASQPSPRPTTAPVPPTEARRLQDLAAQLQDIAAQLQAVPQAVPPPAESVQDPDAPLPGGFIADAYERVVVTASRRGEDPIKAPSAVTVLSRDGIRHSGAVTVPDLLRSLVGVEVMSLAAGQSDVSLRGFNRELSNTVLVLVDGRSTYLDFVGATLWATLPISVEDIERIEIIRGPGSSVYGANAVTGVINVITRTPSEGVNEVTVGGGLPGLERGSARFAGQTGTVAYRFTAGVDRQARWERPYDASQHGAVQTMLEDDSLGLEHLHATARADLSFLEQGLASVSADITQARGEFYNIGVLGNYALDVQHRGLRGDLAWGSLHLRGFWDAIDGEVGPWTEAVGATTSLRSPVDSDTADTELELATEARTGKIEHRLQLGASYRFKRIAGFTYLGQAEDSGAFVREHHLAAFINEEATLGRLSAVGSLRADKDPLLPLAQTLSPRGALVLRVGAHSSLRVAGGTAYRAPNLVERYMDFVLPTGRDGLVVRDFGDRSLLPERILSGEIGFRDASSLKHTAELVLYGERLTDRIGLTDVAPLIEPLQPGMAAFVAGTSGWANLDDASTGLGVEAVFEWFPQDGLDLFANAHVQRVFVRGADGSEGVDGSAPTFKLNLGGTVQTPWRVDFSGSGCFTSSQVWTLREFDESGAVVGVDELVPARVVLSGRVGWRATDALELAGTVWNGLALSESARFAEHPKGQLVGPRAALSATARF